MNIDDLDAKTRQAYINTVASDYQSKELGAERHKKKSVWARGLDILSRGTYTAANAVKEGVDAQAQGKDFWDTIKATGHGAAQGFEGKRKTTFEDVIQHMGDLRHAMHEGKTNLADVQQGEGHVNPWLKYGLGLTGDIALDPTTYVGVGLATKGAKGAEAIKQIENTAKAVKAAESAGYSKKAALAAFAAHKAPVEGLSRSAAKKLAANPELSDVMYAARSYQKDIGSKAVRAMRKDKGQGSAHLGAVVQDGKTARDILSHLENEGTKTYVSKTTRKLTVNDVEREVMRGLKAEYPSINLNEINTWRRKGLGIQGALTATGHGHLIPHAMEMMDPVTRRLEKETGLKVGEKIPVHTTKTKAIAAKFPGATEIALKNASPAVKKQLALRFAGAEVKVPLVAEGVSAVGRGLKKVDPVAKGIEHFNNGFRARAGISDAVNMVRAQHTGSLGQQLVHYSKNLRNVYHGISKEERQAVMKSYRDGVHDSSPLLSAKRDMITGEHVHLGTHFKQSLEDIQQIAHNFGLGPEDINHYLPKSYHAPMLSKRGEIFKSTEHPNWLMEHVRTAKGFNDPAKALHFFNAAVQQAATKTMMESTFGKMFGVAKQTIVGGKGKTFFQHTEQTRQLQNQGWREVKGSKELRGTLFHPDVAHSIERVNEVFKNRQSTEGFLRQFEKATSAVKSSMTLYNPGFHPRTAMGEFLLTYLGGVPLHEIPRYYLKAGKVMAGRDKNLVGAAQMVTKTKDMSRAEIRTANVLHNREALGHLSMQHGGEPVVKTKFGTLSADQIWHNYMNSGVKTGFASADLVKSDADRQLLSGRLSGVSNAVHKVSENEEDFGRLAHFIYELKHSKAHTLQEASNEAAQKVLKYHLDYSSVTKTEQGIASYGVPFYKWLRLSTPVMVDVLLHNPGRVMQVPKTLSTISKAAGYDAGEGQGFMPAEPDIMLPDFLRQHGAYPMFGGNTHYYDPTSLFPVAGSVDLFNGGLDQKLNPLITRPLGVGKGKQSAKDWWLNSIPQTKLANQMVSPPDPGIDRLERLLMYLGNPGFVSNTPKKVKSEVFKERDASYKNRKKRPQELGYK